MKKQRGVLQSSCVYTAPAKPSTMTSHPFVTPFHTSSNEMHVLSGIQKTVSCGKDSAEYQVCGRCNCDPLLSQTED